MLKPKKIAAGLMPDGVGIRRKLFLSINLLLLALILMLGAAMLQNVHTPGFEPEIAYAALAETAKTDTTKPESSIPKLDDYSIIWERNLFNTSNKANPVSRDESADVKIALAKRDMDLELVGTVVSNDPDLNHAFIMNRSTGAQKAYRQGDRVDGGLIKKILHAKVIIFIENSDELMTFRVGRSPTLSKASSYAYQISDSSEQGSAQNSPGDGNSSVALTHKEVETSLADIDTVVQRYEISPFIQGEQPMGLRIENIIPDSIFDKMGLRYGEAITAVNGEPIAWPGQTAEFFQRLKAGGNFTLKVQKKPRGVRRRARLIHLVII